MSPRLTTDILRTAYNFLSETKPFKSWNLPDGEDIKFRIIRAEDVFGWYNKINGVHTIAISTEHIKPTEELLKTMSHELVHLHQALTGMPVNHGAVFRKLAQRVCRFHGWNVKDF